MIVGPDRFDADYSALFDISILIIFGNYNALATAAIGPPASRIPRVDRRGERALFGLPERLRKLE